MPEAAEERDSFCDRLQGRVAVQPHAGSLQQAVLRKGSVDAEAQQGSQEKRRLLHEQGHTQAHNGTEDSTGGAPTSVVGTGISVQGSSSAADGSAYHPAPASNLNVGDMAAWANGGASPSPVAVPVNPPAEPVLTPTGSPADAAGSSPGAFLHLSRACLRHSVCTWQHGKSAPGFRPCVCCSGTALMWHADLSKSSV